MEIKTCVHPKLKFGDGTLTGGPNYYDLNSADTLILLDKMYIPNFKIIDSYGEMFSNQRVIYFPITDMSIPQKENWGKFSQLIDIIHNDLICGKSVHVQCIGGHGRTGLVIACYVGKYQSSKNPVKWVRKHYCEEAVESWKQVEFISNFTDTRLFTSQNKFYLQQTVVVQENKRYDEWWKQLIKEVDEMETKKKKKGGKNYEDKEVKYEDWKWGPLPVDK